MPLPASTSPSNVAAPPASRSSASWWRSPQRVWLRRAIFQVHLWLGIVLAAYSVVIGVSGSVLVFRDEIGELSYGHATHVTAVPRTMSLDAAVKKIAADRPEWVPVALRDMQSTSKAAFLIMRPRSDGKSTQLRYVYFNQWTGQVVYDRLRFGSVMGWCENLHYFLLSGRTGLLVSGWMALGLLLLCGSGLVLWWPGVSRWAAALVLRKRGGWKRFNWDVHSVVGFWSSFALIGVTFTGLYFAFPVPVAGTLVKVTGGSIAKALQFASTPKALPAAPGTPVLSLDEAVLRLNSALQPAPMAEYVQLPVGPQGVYGGLSYYPGTLPYTEQKRVAIDPHTGAVLSTVDTHDMDIALHAVQYFHTVHFGTFGGGGWLGIAVRCVWVLLGLTPGILAVTGVVMYWNRKLAPMWKRHKARAV